LYGNFLGKFPESPKIVDFLKCKLPFLEENQMEQKFPVRNFQKFVYSWEDWPLFRKFLKMQYISSICHLKLPRIKTNISAQMKNAHDYFNLDV